MKRYSVLVGYSDLLLIEADNAEEAEQWALEIVRPSRATTATGEWFADAVPEAGQ